MLDWGFIQAGGKSLRMGTDKAWLEIENRPMIEHALAAAQPVAKQVGVIINAENANIGRFLELVQNWGVELISDIHHYRGPLGGIHTALERCRDSASSALILACDLPFITSEFLNLISQIHNSEENELTMPVDQFGRSQPLAAIYSQRCLPVVERLLADDSLRLDGIYPSVKLRHVHFEEFAGLTNAENLFLNVNTKEHYIALRDVLKR
jgi:molybdenum cofactor guanylyltransferase